VAGHGLAGVADTGAFLARLTRLDPAALVRLRRSGDRVALWGRLPWGVLVTRDVAGDQPAVGAGDSAGGVAADVTVSAAALLSALSGGDQALPPRLDQQWRWPLPPVRTARQVESVAVAEIRRLAAAAAGTLREVTATGLRGRAIGQRVVRDALLDHVALVVTAVAGDRVEIPQRLVQAVARMGFLGPDADSSSPADVDGPSARVYVAGRWVGLSAPYGVAWHQSVNKLTVMPIATHPFG